MEIRAPLVFKTLLKSFKDVVLPAVDQDNSLAQEQAHLMVGLLTLMSDRVALQREYDLDELQRLVNLGEELQRLTPAEELGYQVERSGDALARARAAPNDLLVIVNRLSASVGDRVEALAGQNDAVATAAARAVLKAAREQQLRERSWLLMQGWETKPDEVPPIDTLIPAIQPATTGGRND